MIVLGIDPGSLNCGYGVVQIVNNRITFEQGGVIDVKAETLAAKRLFLIKKSIIQIAQQYQIAGVAVEQVFIAKNPNSAIKLGQARGAILAALGELNLPVAEYAPRTVKKAVTGKGAASKLEVQRMVKYLFKLNTEPPADMADALAVAYCHSCNLMMQQRFN